MKYYMLNAYKDIPQYAEVEMIGHCYDSGYSCYEVRWMGRTYKPFAHQVVSEDLIKKTVDHLSKEYQKWLVFASFTINGIQ